LLVFITSFMLDFGFVSLLQKDVNVLFP